MATCPQCRSSDLVRIQLQPHGDSFRFSACRRCECKWWTGRSDEDTVDLPAVLEAVGTRSA